LLRFRLVQHQLVRVHQNVQLPRLWIRIDKEICYSVIVSVKIHEVPWNHSLRFEAWEHSSQTQRQEWNRRSGLWQWLPWERNRLYLHIITFLSRSWYHSWLVPIHSINWHVEFWLYHDWAVYRLPSIPRNQWEGTTSINHRCDWYASRKCFEEFLKKAAFLTV